MAKIHKPWIEAKSHQTTPLLSEAPWQWTWTRAARTFATPPPHPIRPFSGRFARL